MHEPLKYFHVNWIDGMKINKNHFIALENAFKDQVKDAMAIGLNDKNWGLLPGLNERNNPLKIVLTIDNQKTLQVKIFECRAITPGGARIEIYENSSSQQGFTVPFPENTFEITGRGIEQMVYIAIAADPFSRVPVGNADPSEEPPRYPFVNPAYNVHI